MQIMSWAFNTLCVIIKIEAIYGIKNKKPVDSLHKKQKTSQKFCPLKTLCYLCIRKHQ